MTLYNIQFLKKVCIHLAYDATIPLLCIYPRGKKRYILRKTFTQIFTVALFAKPKPGNNNPHVLHRYMDKQNCSILTQWNTIQQQKNEGTTDTHQQHGQISE